MPLQISAETVERTVMSIDGDFDPNQRVKFVYDDGTTLFFKVKKDHFTRVCLELDQDLTDNAVVDDIMLPESGPWSLCGHENCPEDGHTDENPFDPFSIITVDQYKALRRVYIELERFSRDETPQIGRPLSLWQGWREDGGGSGWAYKHDNVVTSIELVTVGTDS